MTRLQYAFLLIATVCSAVSTLIDAERVRYDNYHVYQLTPVDIEQLAVIKQLETVPDYIFLNAVHFLGNKIHVIVAPQSVAKFLLTLEQARITHELLENDAQARIEQDEVADPNRRSSEYSFDVYHELNDTYSWLHTLAAKYPQQVSVIVAGRTHEGRQILGIKISFGPGKRGIFLEAGIHAREWIGPATATYIAHQLLTSDNKEVRMIAENFDWYIIPHANPDGFVYSHTNNRLWRKTRKDYGNDCFGADPNRNWDFHWSEVGTSSEPCSDSYAGPAPFSEVETRSLAEYIATLGSKLFMYIAFHSYSQLLLFPYGHTAELPPNYVDLKRVFDVAIEGVQRRYGTKYTGGNIHDAIYPSAGGSIDWIYGELDVKYCYCYELRPSDEVEWDGWQLPAKEIIPTGEETLDSMVEMIKEAGITSFL